MGVTTRFNSYWQTATVITLARVGLALVPEGRQIFPNLSVYENLIATAIADQAVTPADVVRLTAREPAELHAAHRHLDAPSISF